MGKPISIQEITSISNAVVAAMAKWQLDLSNKMLTELPPEMVRSTDLTYVDLSNNQLTTWPAEIGDLSNLRKLDLSNNQLTTLPAEIDDLSDLRELDLSNNQLTTLPAEIGHLSQLTELDLSRNQLVRLPAEIRNLTNLTKLDLRDNSLSIPPEILARSNEPELIINYYLQGSKNRLNEAKMLLVGQGEAGKTSLVKRLIEDSHDFDETTTEGINIRPWWLTVNNEAIRLNVWDFGGQEIMHATHQFFLTQRSLYLLVLNARAGAEESGLEHWLKIIESFAGDSPIIVVINKIDEYLLQLNERGLRDKYPNIKAFVKTSSVTSEGIGRLKELIRREIAQLEHLDDLLPDSWLTIKDELSKINADYLSYERYQGLCREQGIDDTQAQHDLIRLLHDLGIVLNFQDDPRLQSTNILNPEWLTNGVYKILNARILVNNHGILERHQLNDILDPVRYPPDKQLLIIDMMRKFELCYDLEPDQKFLIPDLLPIQQPDLRDWNRELSLAFQYHYKVLPSSIIYRFIVRMQRDLLPKKAWGSGVLLNHEETNNQALVIADELKISVWVKGTQATRRSFLSLIRDHFDHIHASIPKIKVKQVVPLPNQPNVTIDYQDLRQLEKKGISHYYVPKANREIDVKSLLDKIESPRRRYESAQMSTQDEHTQQNVERIPWLYIGGFVVLMSFIMALLFVLIQGMA
ncbi:MAG: COR domain-containing protein [Ardenticatenaceae bacterium]